MEELGEGAAVRQSRSRWVQPLGDDARVHVTWVG